MLLILIGILASCDSNEKKASQEKIIVCTTGMLGDAVENIVGSNAKVITLMQAGVDPHLYKPTQGDVQNLMEADIIVYNGLHLEGKMGQIFEKLEKQKIILPAADGIPTHLLINNTDFAGAHDPHIWFDVSLWSKAVGHLSKELIATAYFDSSAIQQNWKSYEKQLKELHEWTKSKIAEIPVEHRSLITSHDAFGYFGKAYDIKVRGLQGISTVSEYGLRDVSQLVDYIIQNNIKAVFVESSVSERSMNAVVEGCNERGHNVVIGGTLFSDAMGNKDTPEGKYLGMVRHNVNLISQALK